MNHLKEQTNPPKKQLVNDLEEKKLTKINEKERKEFDHCGWAR